MSADLARLPVTVDPVPGEAIDGYLERLAAANGMTHPRLARRIRNGGASTAFLTTAPDRALVANVAALSTVDAQRLMSATLGSLPSIDVAGLDPASKKTWRTVAARGWPPERGSALCPKCLAENGVWRLGWRHPWVTACAHHQVWLLRACPACSRRFRSHRTPMRPVDAPAGTCGNPAGTRGRNCSQPLAELGPTRAPAVVLSAQRRIDIAITGGTVTILGTAAAGTDYLAELKALTVLLLHLATQSGAETLASWTTRARADRERSAGNHGARWALAPPADLDLRGSALAVADAILSRPDVDAAADDLHQWTELTPLRPDGELGWLADHTTMTPTLTRLVMAATTSRRRIATILDADHPARLPGSALPQVLPTGLHVAYLAGTLGVTDHTGRLFASLCLARRNAGARTWAAAATVLGMPAETGTKTACACSADLLVRPDRFVKALDDLATHLDPAIDYRAREAAIRCLARGTAWYRPWARTHHPGSHDASHGYAVTWLWTEYAHGHLDASPGWQHPPDCVDRGRYRHYAKRLTPTARTALVDIAQAKKGRS